MATIKEVVELVKARQPIIWINSYEERRIVDEIIKSEIIGLEEVKDTGGKTSLQINPRKRVYLWSCTQGVIPVEGVSYKDMDNMITSDMKTIQPVPALQFIQDVKMNFDAVNSLIFIMRDLHQLMNIPTPGRKLRDMTAHLSRKNKTIIIIGPSSAVPDELQKDIYVVDYEFPGPEMIEKSIDTVLGYIKGRDKIKKCKDDDRYVEISMEDEKKKYRVEYTREEKTAIVRASQGLTQQEVACAISKSIQNTPTGEIIYDRIAEEKKNIIKRSEVLEFWTNLEPLSDVGGNADLKNWLVERGHAITGDAVKFGVRPPKGCLITGVQGCGKSMLSKAIAGDWKIPCVRLDMGKIFAGLVGSSERNMRTMIAQAEAMAPIVLWIDEIEKGLSGTGSSNFSDGGTSSRVFGTFIYWLQDKKPGVFIIATANDVSQLPAELLRKGRFDAIWFVDLPTQDERAEILKTHIRRVGRDPKKFDIGKLSAQKYRDRDGKEFIYSGSEIEEAVNDALFAAYCKNPNAVPGKKGDITTSTLMTALENTIPISCTASEKITKIRKWGRKHAKFASPKAKSELDSGKKAVSTPSNGGFNVLSADVIDHAEEVG
jgi:SpoVK/Ycf46/Vps4 family AAA+-type ATPase